MKQPREALAEALKEANDALPKMDERETVYCSIRGDHLRALAAALEALASAAPAQAGPALSEIGAALGVEADDPTKEQILKAIKQHKALINDLTHQVICCGVAASHPDPHLTTTGAYATKWNSAQAEQVRELRRDRDSLRATYLPRMKDGT